MEAFRFPLALKSTAKEKAMKKILIVEDSVECQETYMKGLVMPAEVEALYVALYGGVSFLQAFDRDQALRLFVEHQADIAIVVMDACVPGNSPNTLNLVKRMRGEEKFLGPMIAASSSSDYREKLVVAGCDYSVPKLLVPMVVLGIIDKGLAG